MRSGIPYPDERLLIVRPCHVSLCMDVRPAAKLLSVLLYRYSIRQESKEDADNINELRKAEGREADQDSSFRIYRKQSQLVKDMVSEITEKTLHDVAVPCLQLLGYLDIEEYPGMNCYILHIDRILRGIAAYTEDLKEKTCCQLENFLIERPQLEKVLISVKSLEKILIDKKNFQLALEKVLIDNRKSSNCHRGRKPRSEAGSEGEIETPKIYRDIIDRKKERKLTGIAIEPDSFTPSSTPSSLSSQVIPNVEKLSTEEQRIQGYWKQLGFIVKQSEHWATLSEHIQSFEQFESLFKYTQNALKDKPNKRVYPGNLVDHLDGWKQAQTFSRQKAEGPKPMTALEKIKADEEKYGKTPSTIKPLALFKQKQKEARLAAERKA